MGGKVSRWDQARVPLGAMVRPQIRQPVAPDPQMDQGVWTQRVLTVQVWAVRVEPIAWRPQGTQVKRGRQAGPVVLVFPQLQAAAVVMAMAEVVAVQSMGPVVQVDHLL